MMPGPPVEALRFFSGVNRASATPDGVWPAGFDPANLTADASLNKLVIRSVPGAASRHIGHNGGELLGRDAVATLVRERCAVHPAPGAITDSLKQLVADGRPANGGDSIYGDLDPAALRRLCGAPVRLVHDGSAAWRGTGTGVRSAVITLGTWLGVGMGPHQLPMRPYSGSSR
jgi:hypothetical protein